MIDKEIVINEVCEANGVSLKEYQSNSRERKIIKTKYQVIYILKNYSSRTLKEIGQELNISTSKVNWIYTKISNDINYDNTLSQETEKIAENILRNYNTTPAILYIETKIEELYKQYLELKNEGR